MIRIMRGWSKKGDDWIYSGSMTRFQSRKYQGLINDGLSPTQAREFIWYKFGLAFMRRFRSAIRRGEAGTTKSSAWDLWRKFHDEAVEKFKRGKRGGFKSPDRKYDSSKPHRKLDADGNVDKEHANKMERERRASLKSTSPQRSKPNPTDEEKIRQLEISIKNTNDPVKIEQHKGQIRNIRARMNK